MTTIVTMMRLYKRQQCTSATQSHTHVIQACKHFIALGMLVAKIPLQNNSNG